MLRKKETKKGGAWGGFAGLQRQREARCGAGAEESSRDKCSSKTSDLVVVPDYFWVCFSQLRCSFSQIDS